MQHQPERQELCLLASHLNHLPPSFPARLTPSGSADTAVAALDFARTGEVETDTRQNSGNNRNVNLPEQQPATAHGDLPDQISRNRILFLLWLLIEKDMVESLKIGFNSCRV